MNNSSCGNNWNKSPPRSPRIHAVGCSSPPRPSQSHHESEVDNEVTSEDLMRFQQDELLQKLILKALE